MAQTTQTRERGRPLSEQQQQAPREAPRNNVPATTSRPAQQQQAAGGSTRGLSQAERGARAITNLEGVMARFGQDLDTWSRGLYEVGKSTSQVNFFREVLQTAVAEKPDLVFADRRTFFNSAKKCFLDGLLPDGRDAALVVYRTAIKVRDSEGLDTEIKIDAVQYMPMVGGIRRKMLESGLVTSAIAEAVYYNDHFVHVRGLDQTIEHRTPKMGEDRGKLIGAYSIIRLANGEVLLDSMDEKEILKSKAKSKAQGGMLWSEFPHEAFKKTVLRRLSKSAPVNPYLQQLVNREEEPADGEIDESGNMLSPSGPRYDYAAYTPLRSEPEPEPPVETKAKSAQAQQQEQPLDEVTFSIWDLDGVEQIFSDPFKAFDAASAVLQGAVAMGVQSVDGFWESNQDLLDALSLSGSENLSTELASRYADSRDKADAAERKRVADDQQRLKEKAAADQKARDDLHREAAAATAQGQPEQPAGYDERDPPPADGQDARQAQESGSGATTGASSETRTTAAPAAVVEDVRPSKKIAVPLGSDGKPDYRVFAIALLGPKIKATKGSVDLAWLLGDNTEAIEMCRRQGTLEKAHLETLEDTIRAQFAKLPADS